MNHADTSAAPVAGSILGHPVKRTQDVRLITGAGLYADDVPAALDALHAFFVRSPLAHARTLSIHTAAAEAVPGVVAVHTAATLQLPRRKGWQSIPDTFDRPDLAVDKARFVGEPVAVVVATRAAIAADAAEQVMVDYDPLPAVVSPEDALAEDAALLFEETGSNVCQESAAGPEDDPLDGAEVTVRLEFRNQ